MIVMALYCCVLQFLFIRALCAFVECLLIPGSWWRCIAVYFSSYSFVSCVHLLNVCSFQDHDGAVLLCTSVLIHSWAVCICWMSAHSRIMMALYCCVLQFLFIRELCAFVECLPIPGSWWRCIAVYFSSYSFVNCVYLLNVCPFHNRNGDVLHCTAVLIHSCAVCLCWMCAHSIIVRALYCCVLQFLFLRKLRAFVECLLIPWSWWRCIAVYFSSYSFVRCVHLLNVCSFQDHDGAVLLCTSVLIHSWAVCICWMSAHSRIVMAMYCSLLRFLFIRELWVVVECVIIQ
jgi:hypothetical protein